MWCALSPAKLALSAPESLADELRPCGVGRATVYRALERLGRLGMLTRIHVGACQGYTVCEQGHHHHLVCGTCHAVVPIATGAVEREIKNLATRLQFHVDTHMLEFAGQCADCLASSGYWPTWGTSSELDTVSHLNVVDDAEMAGVRWVE